MNSDRKAFEAFRSVEFDWTTRLQDIWRDPVCDVQAIHAQTRSAFAEKLMTMTRAGERGRTASPLGWVLVGSGGSGKSHLLGAMRREAARQGAAFVLVDMTDVRDFWETLAQGYLDSLQNEYLDGVFQHQFLLRNFISKLGAKDDTARVLEVFANRKSTELANDVSKVLAALARKYQKETTKYQDIIRALICLNSTDFEISSAAMSWLQAQEVGDDLHRVLGFRKLHEEPRAVVAGLSWLMSLCGPTVVAFDQLDPIVHQIGQWSFEGDLEPNEERERAHSIINQIGNGLGAMPDSTFNTLAIVSCVEATWNWLIETVLRTSIDRFEPPIRLSLSQRTDAFESLIRDRLAPAYAEHSFAPSYPTWPFQSEAIRELTNETPREVLKLCDAHQRVCVAAGMVSELDHFNGDRTSVARPAQTDGFDELDRRFQNLIQSVNPQKLLEEKFEDEELAPLYQTALQCLIHERENETPPEVDAEIERDFSGGKSTKPLHARLRLVFQNENSREEHYCVRALQRQNHAAFKTRLKAAMTQSGIDKSLKFRHLAIIRSSAPPGGAETAKLVDQFTRAGGRFHEPTEQELRTLAALRTLFEERPQDLMPWLQERKPVCRLNLDEILAPHSLLTGNGQLKADPVAPNTPVAPNGSPHPVNKTAKTPTTNSSPVTRIESPTRQLQLPAVPTTEEFTQTSTKSESRHDPLKRTSSLESASPPESVRNDRMAVRALPFGRKILGLNTLGEVVSLPLPLLSKHTIVLGGSGSGKTVTVRRLVEEAALAGIPSLIIDCARDMLSFDERWPEPPETWRDGDANRAAQFHDSTELIVWTPGREGGNPLQLAPLPDFTPLANDREELEEAVQMAAGGLVNVVASGNSSKAQAKEGLLIRSLQYFALHFPNGGIRSYVDLLSSLPPEAGLGVKQERKYAEEMADSLRIEMAKNPLMRSEGTPLDPATLFGDDRKRSRTRISVISFLGLPTDDMQSSFLNQMAMLLFSWIKKNPNPPGDRPLRGLLVIDEAKDFVPSQRKTACKESIMRLAAQARKYRLGLVFATQHPKDIDTKIVGNCATHLYGLNNSPASLATLEDLMQQKEGDGRDIPRLKRGQFYLHNADAGHMQPIKTQIPHSLSLSPPSPLEQDLILVKAQRSREWLFNQEGR